MVFSRNYDCDYGEGKRISQTSEETALYSLSRAVATGVRGHAPNNFADLGHFYPQEII